MIANTNPVPADNDTVTRTLNPQLDPVAAVLDAAAIGLVPDYDTVRWTARRVEPDPADVAAGLIAEYHLDKKIVPAAMVTGDDAPETSGAEEITEDFIASVRHVMNAHLTVAGQRWYVDGPYADGSEPGIVARVRFLCLTDAAAAEAGLYPW